jgi:LysR family glycine cleavage system transcriptional activator
MRAFEAAARHGSFSAAAKELSLTQSAISHEVKALETYFGTALFRRSKSGLILTRRGHQAFSVAQGAFADLSGLATDEENRELSGTVTIAAPPLFCAHWLLPRIDRFTWANPGIEFRLINVTEDRPELLREVDIAIIWGTGIPDGYEGVKLMSVRQTPVASPALLGAGGVEEQSDLVRQHRILHEGSKDAWQDWCSQAGMAALKPMKEWIFDDPALMIEACLRGHGIALGTLPLIDSLISEGRLVALSRRTLPASRHYLLTHAVPSSGGRVATAVFRWLTTAT